MGDALRTPGDRGAMDTLMAEAALGAAAPVMPVDAALRLALRLLSHPTRPALRLAAHGAELRRIAAGASAIEPGRDRRFRDSGWSDNAAFERLAQTYLATCRTADGLIADGGLDWRSERRLRMAAANVLDALAPSNNPLLNPAVIKTAIDSGGRSLLQGVTNLANDLLRPGTSLRTPRMVDAGAFAVGETVAATPGAVVARSSMFELLQYRPQTPTVQAYPLLVVPSAINKYYVADLAPGRSLIEHAVAAGHQAFAISWRNPGPDDGGWDLTAYAGAVLEALDMVEEISGGARTHVAGLCAGGVMTAAALAHRAARGEDERTATATFIVAVLDHDRIGDIGALVDERSAEAATAESARRGYVDGEALAGVFAWMRPQDRIWRYWVQNYLLGRDASASDILYWNADTANLAAGLHRDLLELAIGNALARPGAVELLGTPLDLGRIGADVFYVAGLTDHLTPWEAALRSARLFGGERRFALAATGHVTTVVAAPGDARASYWSRDLRDDDEPEPWLAGATPRGGSWWPEWTAWLEERGGGRRRSRQTLGSKRHPVLAPAPGTYVFSGRPG